MTPTPKNTIAIPRCPHCLKQTMRDAAAEEREIILGYRPELKDERILVCSDDRTCTLFDSALKA